MGQHDDDGVLVDVVLAVGEERAARRKHRELHAVIARPLVAAPSDVDWNVMRRRFAQPVAERPSAILLAAVRDRIDPQRAHDRREPADVIAVGNLRTSQARLPGLDKSPGDSLYC